MTTERDATIMEEHHEIAGGRIAEAARDDALSPVPAEPATPAEALDLAEIEARANAATEGPWHGEHEVYEGRAMLCVSIGNYGWVCAGERAPEYDVDSEQGKADAEFIAHSRTDVPALVAEVRRLRTGDGFRRERAILRWAADRAEASGAPYATVTDLRRWADGLEAAPTYALPAEPPAGERLCTEDGAVWLHDGKDPVRRWRHEINYRGERVDPQNATRLTFAALLEAYAPLSTVPPEGWVCPIPSHGGAEWLDGVAHCTAEGCEHSSAEPVPPGTELSHG